MQTSVSIIICTYNRAGDLRRTLAALAALHVNSDLPAEVVVVDNASTDATAELAQTYKFLSLPIRYVYEPRRGKGYAYNAGLATAQGDVLLFTDDDVRPPKDWIEGMCAPLLSGKAQAVAGGVHFAPHLERDWMVGLHRQMLASTDYVDPLKPEVMIGANMAFSREVLTKVPAFDVELGPGALGFADETLFSCQLLEAGYTIATALDVSVEHHFEPIRLSRAGFLRRSDRGGRCHAYLCHHWYHRDSPRASLYALKRSLRMAVSRAARRKEWKHGEGAPEWEMRLAADIGFYRQMLIEQKRPRNYVRHGLVRLDGKR